MKATLITYLLLFSFAAIVQTLPTNATTTCKSIGNDCSDDEECCGKLYCEGSSANATKVCSSCAGIGEYCDQHRPCCNVRSENGTELTCDAKAYECKAVSIISPPQVHHKSCGRLSPCPANYYCVTSEHGNVCKSLDEIVVDIVLQMMKHVKSTSERKTADDHVHARSLPPLSEHQANDARIYRDAIKALERKLLEERKQKALKEELEHLKTALSLENQKYDDLHRRTDKYYEQDFKVITDTLDALFKKLDKTRKEKEAVEAMSRTLEKQNNEADERVKQLEAENQKRRQLIANLEHRLKSLKAIDWKENRIDQDLAKKIKFVEKYVDALREKAEREDIKIAELRRRNEAIAHDYRSTLHQLDEAIETERHKNEMLVAAMSPRAWVRAEREDRLFERERHELTDHYTRLLRTILRRTTENEKQRLDAAERREYETDLAKFNRELRREVKPLEKKDDLESRLLSELRKALEDDNKGIEEEAKKNAVEKGDLERAVNEIADLLKLKAEFEKEMARRNISLPNLEKEAVEKIEAKDKATDTRLENLNAMLTNEAKKEDEEINKLESLLQAEASNKTKPYLTYIAKLKEEMKHRLGLENKDTNEVINHLKNIIEREKKNNTADVDDISSLDRLLRENSEKESTEKKAITELQTLNRELEAKRKAEKAYVNMFTHLQHLRNASVVNETILPMIEKEKAEEESRLDSLEDLLDNQRRQKVEAVQKLNALQKEMNEKLALDAEIIAKIRNESNSEKNEELEAIIRKLESRMTALKAKYALENLENLEKFESSQKEELQTALNALPLMRRKEAEQLAEIRRLRAELAAHQRTPVAQRKPQGIFQRLSSFL